MRNSDKSQKLRDIDFWGKQVLRTSGKSREDAQKILQRKLDELERRK